MADSMMVTIIKDMILASSPHNCLPPEMSEKAKAIYDLIDPTVIQKSRVSALAELMGIIIGETIPSPLGQDCPVGRIIVYNRNYEMFKKDVGYFRGKNSTAFFKGSEQICKHISPDEHPSYCHWATKEEVEEFVETVDEEFIGNHVALRYFTEAMSYRVKERASLSPQS